MAAFSPLWSGIAVAPHLQLLRSGDVFGERFLYLASVGLCWLVGALWDGTPPRRRRLLGAGLLALALLLTGRSWRQATRWRDPVASWESSVASGPAGGTAWHNLGMARLRACDAAGAAEALPGAIRLRPNAPESRQVLVLALTQAGQTEQALAEARAAHARWPEVACVAVNLAAVLALRAETGDDAGAREARGRAAALGGEP